MSGKLKAKLGSLGQRLASTWKWFRWIIIYMGLGLVGASIAVGVWVAMQPLDRHKERAIGEIKKALNADFVSIGKLSWDFALSSFSFGVRVKDLRIKGAKGLQSISVPELSIYTQPIKLLMGGVPGQLIVKNPMIRIGPGAASETSNKKTEARSPITFDSSSLPKWSRYIRLKYQIEAAKVDIAPELLDFESSEHTNISIEKVNLSGEVSGLPGTFNAKMDSEFNVGIDDGKYIVQGPADFSIDGFFQLENGRPVSLNAGTIHANLDKMNLALFNVIEKTAGTTLRLDTQAQIPLNPRGEAQSVEFSESQLSFDNIPIKFSGLYAFESGLKAKWTLNRTVLEEFHVPIKNLRSTPFSGVLESSGAMSFTSASGFGGAWKLSLNNVKVDASALEAITEKSSTGHIMFSLVSEGSIDRGHFISPRTEFQLEGSSAMIVLKNDVLMKPAGDRFELLVKADVRDDTLTVRRLTGQLNNMAIEGTAELSGIDKLSGENDKAALIKINLRSNSVDLSRWKSYIKRVTQYPAPIDGFFEVAGSAEGRVSFKTDPFKDLSWRMDRVSFSNVKGTFAKDSFMTANGNQNDYVLSGPFVFNFIFQGRGLGSRVDRATLLSRMDFTKVGLLYKDTFRKAPGVPLFLEANAEQSRNELKIKRGQLRFHTLDLGFSGTILQGSNRSSIELAMAKPVSLSEWREFFVKSPNFPVDGQITWKGRVGFGQKSTMEADFDWRQLSLEGYLRFANLSGRFGDMKNPLHNGSGSILFQPSGVVIPQFSLSLGRAVASMSGEITALNQSRKKQMTLNQLFIQKAWDISSQVSLNQLDATDFSDGKASANGEAEEASMGEEIRKLLKSSIIKQSRLKLALRARQGKFGDIQYANLNMRALWENAAFKVQPFSLDAFDGQVSGSMLFDSNPFYLRKESPQSSATLKVRGINAKLVAQSLKPEMEKLIGGSLSGDLTLTSEGFDADELIRNSKGRLVGKLQNGYFESFHYLKSSLDSFISSSAAKDYLVKEASKEKCLQKNFDASLDSQLKGGEIEIQAGRFDFKTGSSVELKGKIAKDLNTALSGDFIAGTQCLGGDAQKCLAGASGRAAIPFNIEGPAFEPKVSLDSASIAKSLAQCMTRKIAKKAEAAIQKEATQQKNNLENLARDKLKKIFK